jgi:hypothetical protein
MIENDALSLEYKLNEGRAGRQVNLLDFVNNTLVESENGVLGLGFEKEILDLGLRQLRSFNHDGAHL